MAIKLRIPEPNEERLSWCKGVDVEICTDSGRISGKLDFKFLVLPPEEVDAAIHGEDPEKIYRFNKRILKGVAGMTDEDGNAYPDDVQMEFALNATELGFTIFKAYLTHIGSGEARKKS